MATLFFSTLLLSTFLFLSKGDFDDQQTMFALRKEISVPDWYPNEPNYCTWRGVKCTGTNNTVRALELPRVGLRGNLSLISNLKSLTVLDLSSNLFTGPIPASLGDLSNIVSLNLSNNFLSGTIPDEFKKLEKLQELQISGNNLTGSIPNWVGNFSNLRFLSAYENGLTGSIPKNLGLFTNLQILNLHSNKLEGEIPESIFKSGQLKVLILTVNRLSGSIPYLIGTCKGLSNIRIGNNRLTGRIPVSIGDINSLTYFEADYNNLSGEIVPNFALCLNLTLLNLASNGLTGLVPDNFGDLRNLQEFIVSNNNLTGNFPKSVLKCRNLSKLDLSYNNFIGSLPDNLCNYSRLQFLLLDHNSFNGFIPGSIGNCIRLLDLQMGSNSFIGNIPNEIGKIRNLQIALNLSFNKLEGPLPRELGKLDKLVSLDLSNNQISGPIPLEIKGMLSLIEVNFSNNRLNGFIPDFVPFQKSPQSSFLGNEDLCGDPLSSNCKSNNYGSSDYNNNYTFEQHKATYKIVLVVVGSGVVVFGMVSCVVVLFMIREKQEKEAKGKMSIQEIIEPPPHIISSCVFIESLKQAIDFETCINATLKDSNKLANSTFSTTFKAVMPSGLVIFIKKLNSVDQTVTHHQNKMIRELERLSNLNHVNLIRPIGYVIYDDVALLLHNYLPNGTLMQLIHEKLEGEVAPPDWPRRLDIVIGLAEGIAFLHNIATIHLDICSGNVYLDSYFNAVLGEIEISKILDPSKGTASISAVAGSFGYIPPEYAYTMQVTVAGNVYSFGVVLLEILTSKLPVDESFEEGIDLVKWVKWSLVRGETPEQIMDPRLSTVSFAWRKQMLEVLKVAMLCTDHTPSKRPKMKKVVEMLKEAKESKKKRVNVEED